MTRVAGEVEWFSPTSGRTLGGIGLGISLLVLVLVLADGPTGRDLTVACAAIFVAALIWATMLRPRAGLNEEDLVLRNPLSEVRVPLAAIEQLGLQQVLAVRAGDRRFVSTAVGRSLRSMRKTYGQAPDPLSNYSDFVEDRIRRAMESARARAGVALMSDEQLALADGVRRDRAWPEILALAVPAAVLTLLILV